MSNIYVQEPHTSGKVVLHTTYGDIDIELWSKETPKTCRNFLQLCLEGYYNDTIFHRIVPEFIIQGGDPTGTGSGGESIYGKPFADEFHSRLRFIRRGLVAMANAGPNDNGSQFFITLARTDELQNKHTIFGKVVGDTIFNVIRMGQLDIDSNERPLYPPKIITTEVLNNPFDDIIPRMTPAEKAALEKAEELEKQKAKKKKEKKNSNLLSFEEEGDAEAVRVKIKSSHDLLKDDPRLRKAEAVESQKAAMKEGEKAKVRELEQRVKVASSDVTNADDKDDESAAEFDRRMRESVKERMAGKQEKKLDQREVVRNEIDKVKQEIQALNKRKSEMQEREKESKKPKVSMLELERQKYLNGKQRATSRKDSSRENELMKRFNSFTKKLSQAVKENKSDDTELPRQRPEPSGKSCELHGVPGCESCGNAENANETEETDEGWITHVMIAEKDRKGKDLMQRQESVHDYVVIDPRERKEQALRNEREKRRGKSSRDRASSKERSYERRS
ncbi:uncharacterized protein VTP21DRAFT_992 [Calcarisporiella thermophila]|uniref:uncharacterized protein n=1 Tax=Calcarisporiella thermophila TaxID=911321 RepID=UPI003742BB42